MTTKPADIQTLVGYLIPQLAQQLQLQANTDERSYSGLTGYLRGNPTLAREAYGASREDAMRQYAVDVAQLGIQQANLNFQQRVAEADTKLQELSTLAQQRGPKNAIAYNYLLNNGVVPEGKAAGDSSISMGINQPYSGATPQAGGATSAAPAGGSPAAPAASDYYIGGAKQASNPFGTSPTGSWYSATPDEYAKAAATAGNVAAPVTAAAPQMDQTPGWTLDTNGVNLSAAEIANGAQWHAAEGGFQMPEDFVDGPLGRVEDFDRGTAPWMRGPEGSVADLAANMPWLSGTDANSGMKRMANGGMDVQQHARQPQTPPPAPVLPDDFYDYVRYLRGGWNGFADPETQPLPQLEAPPADPNGMPTNSNYGAWWIGRPQPASASVPRRANGGISMPRRMAQGGFYQPDGKAWGYGPTREPLLPPLDDLAYGTRDGRVPDVVQGSSTRYIDWLLHGGGDNAPNFDSRLDRRANGGITMGEPVIVGDPKGSAPSTPNVEMAAPVMDNGQMGMAVMPADKMEESAESPAYQEGYAAQMQGQPDPQRMKADKEYLAGVMACQAASQARGGQQQSGGMPMAADGGVFSNTVYSPTDIANAPSLQKLAGNLGTGFGQTGLDYTIPGAGGAGLPQANRANLTTLSRMLPSELGFTQGVVETPREMGGLGLDWTDYLAGAKRSAPTGAAFSGATVYG